MTRTSTCLKATALACMVCLSSPGLSAPWTFGTEPGLFEIQFASQFDTSGKYKIVVDCSSAMGSAMRSLAIVETEPWDATADYAPEVPTVFEVDGSSRQVDLYFAEHAGQQSVALYEDPTAGDDFFEFITAAMVDEEPIAIRYFDRDLQFSGEGSSAGLNHVTLFC